MNKNIDKKKENLNLQNRDFSEVYDIIATHRDRVVQVVNNESLLMIWEVGGYVSKKISTAEWGDGVVRQLSEYIRTKDPTIRGWSYRTIYKMVQFYETYSSPAFNLQQGDIIYVKPNDKRVRESTINGNNIRSTSFWFSVTSMLTSLTLLVIRFIPELN